MYVIAGATGNTGHAISESLLATGKKVKAIVRNKAKAQKLADQGAEILEGGLDDAAFLSKAFAGATAVYILIPPRMDAVDFPAYQAAMGEAQVRALHEAKVPYAVHLSSMGAHTPVGTGVVAGLFHQERRLNRLPHTHVLHLRAGYFMENMLASIPMLKHQNMLGGALAADAKMAFIATKDIADYAVKRLLSLDFSGKEVQELLGSRDATPGEFTSVLASAVGKAGAKWIQFPDQDFVQALQGFGISASVAQGYVGLSRSVNEGRLQVIERDASNTTATSPEDFARTVFKPAYEASP